MCARLFLCFENSCALVSQADRSVPKGGACDIYGRSSKLSAGAVLEPAPVIATYLRPPTVEPGDAHACTPGQCFTVFDSQPASFVLAHSQRQTCPRPAKPQDAPSVAAWQADLNVRVYQLNSEGAADETEGDVTSCQIWMLPATVLMCSKHAFVPVGSSCVHMCLLCCSGHHALRTCVLGRNFTGFGTL